MSEADGVKAQVDEVIKQFRDAQMLMQQALNLIDEGIGGIVAISVFNPSGLRGALIASKEASDGLGRLQMYSLLNAQEELHHYRRML